MRHKYHVQMLVGITLTRACCGHLFHVMKVSESPADQLWLVFYSSQSPHFPKMPLPSTLLVYTGIFELQSGEVSCLKKQCYIEAFSKSSKTFNPASRCSFRIVVTGTSSAVQGAQRCLPPPR